MPSLRLAGERLQNLTGDGFTFNEVAFAPRRETPRHTHAEAFFTLLLDGDYRGRYGSSVHDCRRGTLLFHPAEEIQSERFGEAGARSFIVGVEARWLERIKVNGGVYAQRPLWIAQSMARELAHADELTPLSLDALAVELLVAASRERRQDRYIAPSILRARQLLHDQFREAISLRDVAAAAGLHPVHVAREFRRAFGASVGEYLRRLRIEYACRQLAASERSVTDIAFDAGFSSHSHFTAAFRRVLGVTPTQYRL